MKEQKVKIKTLVSRPHIKITDLLSCKELANYLNKESPSLEVIEQAEIKIKVNSFEQTK